MDPRKGNISEYFTWNQRESLQKHINAMPTKQFTTSIDYIYHMPHIFQNLFYFATSLESEKGNRVKLFFGIPNDNRDSRLHKSI